MSRYIFQLSKEHFFPPVQQAQSSGLLAFGGDLDPNRLLLAYKRGIFPWYSEGQPILWFAPNPRYVLFPSKFSVQRSLKKVVKQRKFEITIDKNFAEVIQNCSTVSRPKQFGTWITEDMRSAYINLHKLGIAHSFEAWKDGVLVGGLYGIVINGFFAGESMFAHEDDASKVAFVWAVEQLQRWGVELIDCQVQTQHLQRFGAENIPRDQYMSLLQQAQTKQGCVFQTAFDADFFPQMT